MSFFRRVAMRFFPQKPHENRILVLIDWENSTIDNFAVIGPSAFSLKSLYAEITEKLGEIGRITMSVTFITTRDIMRLSEDFYKLGIHPVVSPMVVMQKRDPVWHGIVDEALITFGRELVNETTSFTHVCVVSGDADFTKFCRWLQRQGKKVIIFAHAKKLSASLAECADLNDNGEQMLYTFQLGR
ncbi:MAG: NYN domain-containing protein [Candidatus Staskawiczbacteria bacterium]|jgi:hypothetical protein